jgi:peptidoglycan hydrolase-like protein with peptidoglycan-binding domain
MANVTGVGGGSANRTAFSENNFSADLNNADITNVSAQSYQAKTEFNQADLVRANLETRGIPPMDAASEARLARINPQLANRIRLMAAELKSQGITIMAVSGLRTFAEQNALYAQGRTKPGNIVTNARGGQSLHNYGLAVDVVPLGANGQPDWNVGNDVWQKIGAAGKRQGMEWGGDWTSFVDRPHFQMTAGKSVSTLLGEYNRNGGNLPAIWNDVNRSYPNVGTNTPIPPTPPTSNNLKLGSRGDDVRQLQRDLTRLGYRLEDDGVFGAKTDAAVRRFQRDKNLTADGIVGAKTRAAIASAKGATSTPVPTATLQKGSRGAQVRQLQTALVKLGFMTQAQMNTGPGIFGTRTDAALRAFQRSENLVADGIYGPKTQQALRNALD